MMSPDQRGDITRRAPSGSQSYESSEGSSDCSDDKGSGNSSSDDSRNSSEAYDKFDIEGLPNDHHKNLTPDPRLKVLPKIQFPGNENNGPMHSKSLRGSGHPLTNHHTAPEKQSLPIPLAVQEKFILSCISMPILPSYRTHLPLRQERPEFVPAFQGNPLPPN